jgi:hypothetical protein
MALLIYVLLGVVAGVVVGLKVIAPKTKTKVDDEVLLFLEKYQVPVEDFLKLLQK